MERSKYGKCCSVIDDIYSKITILKELGYTDSKIDSWFLAFCDSRKPFLKPVLMKSTRFSVYSFKEEYVYEKDCGVVKNKIKQKVLKNR
jgi:hypothetical protein